MLLILLIVAVVVFESHSAAGRINKRCSRLVKRRRTMRISVWLFAGVTAVTAVAVVLRWGIEE
jgi:hypothetical protein